MVEILESRKWRGWWHTDGAAAVRRHNWYRSSFGVVGVKLMVGSPPKKE